ncbi:hypothetical protein [Bacillus sp. es.034]|uniref:hypothetical protein n=1 Tax=Bacillus sp. es.034 TaxID=1761763 RepID=UPI000BF704EB|nr:hypothetical protein [Bacillus sp. es.034]PFG05247.1 hypothetical protein ATG71_2074 [Bacillus sp. es.034]
MPLISEKTAELNITSALHYDAVSSGYDVWTYGPTQRREAVYGFDTQLKQYAFPLYLQYKAPETFNKERNTYKFKIDNKAKVRYVKTKPIGTFGQVDLLQRWASGRSHVGLVFPCFENYGVIRSRNNWLDWTCFLDVKRLKRLSSGNHTAVVTPIIGVSGLPTGFKVIVNSEVQEFDFVPTLREVIKKVATENFLNDNKGKDPNGFWKDAEYEIFDKGVELTDLKHLKLGLYMYLVGDDDV